MCKLAIGSNSVGVTWVRVVGSRVTGVRAVGLISMLKILSRLRVDMHIHNTYLSM